MARMIPSLGPVVGSDQATRRLYDLLAAALPERLLVVQDAHWVGKSIVGEPLRDGTAAFAVLDPERGVLLLDVLVGGLGYDPHGARWSRNRGGKD